LSETADLERRFGGLRRLYGEQAYQRLRSARVAVVGLGGVGSWAAEALARSGVAQLCLIDMDHVAESNINRQVQALGATVGAAKVQALRERIADIHPGCVVHCVEEFVAADNWPAVLPAPVDVLIDACDQVRAKFALAQWGLAQQVPVVCVGAAGGKRQAQLVEVQCLAQVTHDPLLASLRQRLRKAAVSAGGVFMGPRCVFSREAVVAPQAVYNAVPQAVHDAMHEPQAQATDSSLNCHGYGSSVTVTATFGMVAAGEAIAQLLAQPAPQKA
jgi:tRNA threonylcarbamoyladenosine dehydratase